MPPLEASINPSLKEDLTNQLLAKFKELISQGILTAGVKLPPERELAQKFAVSRSSLRHALKVLEIMGVLTQRVGDGTYLTTSAARILSEPLEFLVLLDGISLGELAASKEELVAAMQKSLDFCTQAVGKVDESKLGDEIPFFGERKASRAMVLLAVTGDLFDHYSAMAIYLRLNGILPPTARQREGA